MSSLCRTVCVVTMTLVTSAPAAVFVDATAPANGDGTTWATAFRFLQDGLARAAELGSPFGEIRVAGGHYHPDRSEADPGGTGDRSATFLLLERVTIRGGYAGLGAPDPDERDIELYATLLSGDLGGNDSPGYFGYLENSRHVVTALDVDATAVLDGVTIASGHADGAPGTENAIGAGVLCFRSSPTFDHCTIRDNLSAYQGGGVQCKEGSDPRFTNCLFRNNRALDNGGAMYNGASSPVMIDCTFMLNSGRVYAGAICNRDLSNARFERCVFFANRAAEDPILEGGGGAMVNARSHPDVIDCTFTANTAYFGKGGGIVNEPGFDPKLGGSAPFIAGCIFERNVAIFGGAIYSVDRSNPLVTDCTFIRNRAEGYYERNAGGAIYNESNDAVTDHCVFIENEAARGGAVYNYLFGSPVYASCTFTDNEALSDAGGGISNYYATAVIVDCEFEGNRAASFGGGFQNFIAEATLRQCTFSGNVSGTDGGGVYSIDSALTITECLLSGNTALGTGGGFYNGQKSEAIIDNCTISQNNAASGGGVLNHANGTLTIADTTCCENAPDDIGGDYDDAGGNEFYVECPSSCPADVNGDGSAGFADVLAILAAWGECSGCPEDVTGDGNVAFADVLAVLAAWGVCP